MTRIEFNTFGTESVDVKFSCTDKHGLLNLAIIEECPVPHIDYSSDAEGNYYFNSQQEEICPVCDENILITVEANWIRGFVSIEHKKAQEGSIRIIENYKTLDAYSEHQIKAILFNSDCLKTFQSKISAIKQLNEITIESNELEKTLKVQLFIALMDCLQNYLSSKLINSVLNDESLLEKFVIRFLGVRNDRYKLTSHFSKREQMRVLVKKELLDIEYDDLSIVENIYFDTFHSTGMPSVDELKNIVLKKHDIIYRNGKTQEGQGIEVNKLTIVNVIERVEAFVIEMDTCLRTISK